MKYILALDQGTTSSRAILFDHKGNSVAVAQQEFPQIYPQPGMVEHDPLQICASQFQVAVEVLKKASISPRDVAAIGVANQRETTVVWHRKTGKPIYNAIVWQDRRTASACDAMKKRGLEKLIRSKTGLIIDAYFSATKLEWILRNVKGARALAQAGDLAFGTIDSWLLWNLTGGKVHATDPANASRTMLFNIHTCRWDSDLLKLFKIPLSLMPEVRSSSEVYGETNLLGAPIPIASMCGDQQAALFGQFCSQEGMVKNTYGTGCFMLMNTGKKPMKSKHNLLTTVAWRIGNRTTYALEGSIFIAGAAVQWLRDGLGLIKSSGEVETLAASVPDCNGIFFVPAFAGLGAPHWDQYARGVILGITRGTGPAHIARATLESIALQVRDVLLAMQADSGIRLKQLRVDGGACVNNLLMQMQADFLDVPVIRPRVSETTALGAACLAGLAVGYWKDQAEPAKQWQVDRVFKPLMKPRERRKLTASWARAIERSKGLAAD